ncbi:MAG: GAF domain-containing protein, partial [Caldilineales bacterium]|nr:GAF domain-containing protein [Caldilineales bacterium]
RERDWLTILAEVAAQMQATDDVHALADIVVRGGLRFGFRRARLRLFAQTGQEATTDPELVGVSQAGEPQLEGFEGLRAPLSKLLYSKQAIEAGQPRCFKGRELGPGGHDEFYASQGMEPPKGHWFKVPLLSGGHAVGALTLDNGPEERSFGEGVIQQLSQVLALFGSQAADALERARLREAERRQAIEAQLLSDISRQVTAAAAQGNLDALLDEVRRQVRRLMDVTNFMVVLHDLETETLDFRRQYENDELFDRHWRWAGAGLSGRVIGDNQPLLITDTQAYCQREGIRHYGRPAACWLGVPLQVEGQAVGALVVQSYRDRAAYGERERRLLESVADQVAGAIYLAYRLERKAELERQDAARRRLREVLPELIRESEELFWHAVLTTVTHRDGNSFNRAILLWYDEAGEHVIGRMAIGQLTRAEARKAWERDRDAGHTLAKYFAAPRQAWANPTPLQQMIVGERWPVGGETSPCRRVRAEGKPLVVRSDALRGCLPDEVLSPPDLWDDAATYDCALLPVRSPQGVLGVLMVDKAFDNEPLRPGDLDSLARVLSAAMEVWLQAAERTKAQRLGERYEKVLALERTLLAMTAEQGLKTGLEALCRQAKKLSGADAVVVYPYQANKGRYDLDLVSYVGLQKGAEFEAKKKDKPRQEGVAFTVLQSGTLVVPDVARSPLSFGGRPLADHAFLQREGFQALIAAPMRQASTGEPLGVLYLDYLSPQRFDDQEVALAEQLAAVGAVVISAGREMERQRQGRVEAERSEQQRRRDLQLLSNIQAQALASDTDQEKLVRAILQNAAELFDRAVDATLVLLEWEGEGDERRELRRSYRLTREGRLRRTRSGHKDDLIEKALLASSP